MSWLSIYAFCWNLISHLNITCDQASLFFRGGKERLIQLLDYSSATAYCKIWSGVEWSGVEWSGVDGVDL